METKRLGPTTTLDDLRRERGSKRIGNVPTLEEWTQLGPGATLTPSDRGEAVDDAVTDAILTALEKHYPEWKEGRKAEFSGVHMLCYAEDDPRFIRWKVEIGTPEEVGARIGGRP